MRESQVPDTAIIEMLDVVDVVGNRDTVFDADEDRDLAVGDNLARFGSGSTNRLTPSAFHKMALCESITTLGTQVVPDV